MSVDALNQSLKEGTLKVSQGRIRIDAKRALQKLRDFRLADPHHYVLELLRAAVASKATFAEVRVDADDFELRFDGTEPSQEVIRDLLSHALTGGKDAEAVAARFLALGVAGALGLEPAYVRVQGAGLLLDVRPPVEVLVEEKKDEQAGTFVHVRERMSWRVLRDAVMGPTELTVIRQAVRAYPAQLSVNGAEYERALFDEPVLAQAEKTVGSAHLVAAVPERRAQNSTLALDVFGVGVTTRALELPFLQVVAWARDDSLRRNASGSDVVDGDAALEKIQRALATLAEELLEQLVARLVKKDDPAIRQLLTRLALDFSATKPGGGRGKRLDTLPAAVRAALDKAPILPGPSGEWVTLGELRAEDRAGRQLRFARARFPPGTYTQPAVLLDDRTLGLEVLLPRPPRVDVAKEVELRREAAERQAAWKDSPVEAPTLRGERYLARARIETESLSGEVGFPEDETRPRLRFLSLGKLVQQSEPPELELLELHAVVDLKRAVSEKAWLHFPLAIGTGRALDAVRDAATRAVCEALAAAGEPNSRLHDRARGLVAHLSRADRSLKVAGLPEALRRAAIYETMGGGWASLDALSPEVCRYTKRRWPHPSLNGYSVVLLRDYEREALEKLGVKVKDYSENMAREADIRARLEGRAEQPLLRGSMAAKVPLEGEGLKGEVAIPNDGGGGLALKVLVRGYALEECTVPARYDIAAAAVDCAEFKPDEQWRHAQRDDAFARMLSAVKEAERRLAGALLTQAPDQALADFAPGPKRFLSAFLRKELGGRLRDPEANPLDELQRQAADAPLFRGAEGPVSLRQIAVAAMASGRLWVLGELPRKVPKGVFFVVAEPVIGRLLADVIELRAEDASAEVERALAREAFRARPARSLNLPEGLLPRTVVELPNVRGTVALDLNVEKDAEVELLYEGRLLHELTFPCDLPVRALLEVVDQSVDPAERALTEALDALVGSALQHAVANLVEAALSYPDSTHARDLLMRALAAGVDVTLPAATAQRLLAMDLLPCTDGVARSAKVFDGLPRVAYVMEPFQGTLQSGEPVILATTPLGALALSRWRSNYVDVSATFEAEREGRRRLASLPVVERLAVSGQALRRLPFSVDGADGEVALVAGGGGSIELFHLRRALCTVGDLRVPECAAVAVNCDAIRPNASRTGVERDPAFEALLKTCGRHVELLARQVGQEFFEAGDATRAELSPALAQLVLWLFARKRATGTLLDLPLFVRTDGKPLCLRDLADEQRRHKRVRTSSAQGEPLGAASWIWRPRPGETELLAKGPLKLVDGTADLVRAERVRNRPKVGTLTAPLDSEWREPVTGDGVEGEVAFTPGAPSGTLLLEVLRDRSLLEVVSLDHPVGAVARVNCDALKPTREWTKAVRNDAFRLMRDGVEQAIERLLARLLASDTAFPGYRAYAVAAIQWKLGGGGPVAAELPKLVLFRDLSSRPVPFGEVLAQVSRYGRIAFAEPGLAPSPSFEGVVLLGDDRTHALLDQLKLKSEDASQDLRRHRDVEASRSARRLANLKFPGEALIRLDVDAGGFKGELVLPLVAGPAKQLMLARAGVGVSAYDDGGVGVAGVLDHADLPVNDDWTQARPTAPMRAAIDEQLVVLFGRLASLDERLGPGERRRAARYVLRFLGARGTSAPAHLDALPPALWKLGSCKLFWTCDGRWVDLRAIASRVMRRGSVAVVDASLSADELGGDVVLAADALRDGALAELDHVLGEGCVTPRTLAQWRTDREEEDPEDGTALGRGLALLRRESKLLKSGALGRLTADELKQIKLRKARGKVPIHYDVARKVAGLDPEHPVIKRALEESATRPDRLYVLLAAIYGAVNRALDRITDEDELRLVGGLMGHLAANPELLGVPSEPRVD